MSELFEVISMLAKLFTGLFVARWFLDLFDKWKSGQMKDKFYQWLAWKLPRKLVMWCAVRVGANATTGKYSSQIVPELTYTEALKRWED